MTGNHQHYDTSNANDRTNSKIEDRVLKLIRLAGGTSNVNEAANAFARAQALATAHGLDLEELLERDADEEPPPPRKLEDFEERVLREWDRAVPWQITIATAVARANSCGIYSYSGRGGSLRAYGQPTDLAVVAYVFAAIVEEVEQMARVAVAAYKADPDLDSRFDASPRTYGRSWRLGCADAIAQRMPQPVAMVAEKRREIAGVREAAVAQDDMQTLAKATTALARVSQAEDYLVRVSTALTEYREGLGLRSVSYGGATSGSGYAAGRRAGEGISLGHSGRALPGGRSKG